MLTQTLSVALNDPCISDPKCEDLLLTQKAQRIIISLSSGKKLEIINNDYTLNVSLLQLYFSS